MENGVVQFFNLTVIDGFNMKSITPGRRRHTIQFAHPIPEGIIAEVRNESGI